MLFGDDSEFYESLSPAPKYSLRPPTTRRLSLTVFLSTLFRRPRSSSQPKSPHEDGESDHVIPPKGGLTSEAYNAVMFHDTLQNNRAKGHRARTSTRSQETDEDEFEQDGNSGLQDERDWGCYAGTPDLPEPTDPKRGVEAPMYMPPGGERKEKNGRWVAFA
jgi:hypothetical protein